MGSSKRRLLWFATAGCAAAAVTVWWYGNASRPPETRWQIGSADADPDQPFQRVKAMTSLRLEVDLPRAMHVYIASFDPVRGSIAMFPSRFLRSDVPQNPLPEGRHRLPGEQQGLDLQWHCGDVGGPLSVFVVASDEPLAELDSAWRRFRHMGNAAFPGRAQLGTYAPEGGMEQLAKRTEVHTSPLKAAFQLHDAECDGPMRPWPERSGVWLKVLRLDVEGGGPISTDAIRQQLQDQLGGTPVQIPGPPK